MFYLPFVFGSFPTSTSLHTQTLPAHVFFSQLPATVWIWTWWSSSCSCSLLKTRLHCGHLNHYWIPDSKMVPVLLEQRIHQKWCALCCTVDMEQTSWDCEAPDNSTTSVLISFSPWQKENWEENSQCSNVTVSLHLLPLRSFLFWFPFDLFLLCFFQITSEVSCFNHRVPQLSAMFQKWRRHSWHSSMIWSQTAEINWANAQRTDEETDSLRKSLQVVVILLNSWTVWSWFCIYNNNNDKLYLNITFHLQSAFQEHRTHLQHKESETNQKPKTKHIIKHREWGGSSTIHTPLLFRIDSLFKIILHVVTEWQRENTFLEYFYIP